MLTPLERKLARLLLEKASEVFSEREDNDFDVVREAGFTKAESDELWKHLGSWDDPEFAGDLGTCHLDWVLMKYLADKLGEDE
jgi:hypothetical protein